ncbi:MAG: GTPase [Candidatus Bathyarchaeia archaeon]
MSKLMETPRKALIGMVKKNPHDHNLYLLKLTEFKSLVEAAGYEVCGTVIQVRPKESVDYVFGKGKVEEIKKLVDKEGADIFAVYNILSSKQKYNLENYLGVSVLDRYEVTLQIFDNASSDELSKLQVELARLIKSYPYEKLKASFKYRVGREHPWKRSSGEYIYHSVVNTLRRRIARVYDELEKRKKTRIEQIFKRRRIGSPIVCIAGYYSSGKTSLFNALTGLNKPVSPKPFTTLSSKYYLTNNYGEVFLVDTIGFVHDLDPRMLKSFELTLNDIKFADIIILVVDCSDPQPIMFFRLSTCLDILKSLEVDSNRIVVALNKVDLLSREEVSNRLKIVSEYVNPIPVTQVSAKEKLNLEKLMSTVFLKLNQLKAQSSNSI